MSMGCECHCRDDDLTFFKILMVEHGSRYLAREYAAPMVRASTLPFREECCKFGADYAFTEEIIDKKVLASVPIICANGSAIFQTESNFRTAHFLPTSRDKTILQLGTADGILASKAALRLIDFVSEVNVNMGCPKSFSVKGGMGAALLSKPEIACEIIKDLRASLPADFPLTCKIRLIGETSKPSEVITRTSEFIQGLVNAGADAVTLHMRTVPMRPRDAAIWPLFSDVVGALPSSYSDTPIIANGDFFNRNQIDLFRTSVTERLSSIDRTWSNSVMMARGALYDPSIFSQEPIGRELVIEQFLSACEKFSEPKPSVKWILAQMMEGVTELHSVPVKSVRERIHQAQSMADLWEAIEPRDLSESRKRLKI